MAVVKLPFNKEKNILPQKCEKIFDENNYLLISGWANSKHTLIFLHLSNRGLAYRIGKNSKMVWNLVVY